MLPFQQGSGYTLMVLYYNSGKIPKSFLKDGFLFEIGSQGYKESDNMGFGFFTDKKELEKAVTNYNLPPSSILHLQYLWQDNKLVRVGDLSFLPGMKHDWVAMSPVNSPKTKVITGIHF